MRAQDAYLSLLETMSREIDTTLEGLPEELIHTRPGPSLNPVGWNYWHLVRLMDVGLNVVIHKRGPEGDVWHREGFTEMSGYNPDGKGSNGFGIGTTYSDAEVDEVRVPLEVLRAYHRAVRSELEAYLRTVDDTELRRVTTWHLGEASCSRIFEHLIIRSGWLHVGELRYAKGMLGYPDESYLQSERSES